MIVSSESEVRSKLIDHLIVFLGYPPELRAEEFPVYGFNDNKPQRAKHADYITFKSNDYVMHKGKKTQTSLEWVRNNSLLVFEAKDKDEMPENFNQPAYYAMWTRAVAYLVCDGKRIKGYYYKDCTADREILDCKIEDLPNTESFDYFSYENILALKERRLTGNIDNEIIVRLRDYYDAQKSDVQLITHEEDLNVPENTINYMREALGKNSIGLNNLQLTAKFLNLTDTFLQNRIRYDIPEYMLGIPRDYGEVLLYADDNHFIPLFGASVVHYYRNEVDIYDVYNDFVRIIVHTTEGNADDVSIGFHVFDLSVDERMTKLNNIKLLLESNSISAYIKNTSTPLFVFALNSVNNSNALIAKTNLYLKSLELLKTIEEYYEIKFSLSFVHSENVLELLESIATIYRGITQEENHTLEYPQEAFAEIDEGAVTLEQSEPVPDSTNEGRRTNLPDISLFNYVFTPNTIMFLPCTVNISHQSNKSLAIPCCCTYSVVTNKID